MKHLYMLVPVLVLSALIQAGAQTTVELPVTFRNNTTGAKTYTLTVGVDSRATDCRDTGLDEVDLPPPPPDFFPLILPGCTDPNSGTTVTLHRDYRPISSDRFDVTYNVRLLRGPERKPVTIRWNSMLPENIDSAQMLIEFVDTLDMAAQEEFILENEFISALQIRVYYSFAASHVGDGTAPADGNIRVATLSTGDMLMVTAGAEWSGRGEYRIYTMDGRLVGRDIVMYGERTLVPLPSLTRGTYLFQAIGGQGQTAVVPFVRE